MRSGAGGEGRGRQSCGDVCKLPLASRGCFPLGHISVFIAGTSDGPAKGEPNVAEKV